MRTGSVGKKLLAANKIAANRLAAMIRDRPCPPDKILNPATGKCVLLRGAVGKKLVAKELGKRPATNAGRPNAAGPSRPNAAGPSRSPPAADPCPPDKILNPATGKCVLRSGPIGKKIEKGKGPAADVVPVVLTTVTGKTGAKYRLTGGRNARGRPVVTGARGGVYAWDERARNVRPLAAVATTRKKKFKGVGVTVAYPQFRVMQNANMKNRDLPFRALTKRVAYAVAAYNIAPPGATNDVKSVVDRVISGDIAATRGRNIDPSWFEKQARYMADLSVYDLMTVIGYTVRSHEWLGPYQRDGRLPGAGNLKKMKAHIPAPVPLFPQIRAIARTMGADAKDMFRRSNDVSQYFVNLFLGNDSVQAYEAYSMLLPSNSFQPEIVKQAIELFIRDLDRIISKAPPLDASMVVYRGTSHNVFDGIEGRVYDVNAFSSAAFDLPHALLYAGRRSKSGVVQRVTLSPGTRVIVAAMVNLWNEYGENEIILPRGTYEIAKRSKERLIANTGGEMYPMKVTDVVFRSA